MSERCALPVELRRLVARRPVAASGMVAGCGCLMPRGVGAASRALPFRLIPHRDPMRTPADPRSFRSTTRDSPVNSVGPCPTSLGCTTSSYSSINPSPPAQAGAAALPRTVPCPAPLELLLDGLPQIPAHELRIPTNPIQGARHDIFLAPRRWSGQRVASTPASPLAASATLLPSFRRSPGRTAEHRPGRGSRWRDDADPGPRGSHGARSIRSA